MKFNLYLVAVMYYLLTYSLSAKDPQPTYEPLSEKTEEIFEFKEISEEYEYRFNPDYGMNPFIPPIISLIAPSIEIPVINSLQKYPLDKLELVGVWDENSENRKALLLNPVGEGVVVKKGDPLGEEGGSVYKILKNRLVARIFSLAGDGTRIFEDYTLYIKGDKKEQDYSDVIVIKPSLEKVIEGYLEGKK